MERDVKKSLINNYVPICEVSDQKDHKAFHKHSWFIYFLLKQEKKNHPRTKSLSREYNATKKYNLRDVHSPTTGSKTEAAH